MWLNSTRTTTKEAPTCAMRGRFQSLGYVFNFENISVDFRLPTKTGMVENIISFIARTDEEMPTFCKYFALFASK
jgi:hypothetical protein